MRLYDLQGQRKYLTPTERRRFLGAARAVAPEVATFCETLALTGCRISEALNLTANRVDLADGVLIFESLKKRKRGVYRAVPVPPAFLELLAETHPLVGEDRLWTWSRATAWRNVRRVMAAAGIAGNHASARGLRHGFGIKAVSSSVPLNMTQRWLGHADIATTSIYLDAVGPEEKRLAARMWD